MTRPARLADVARVAGVAPAVVSRVVNGDRTLRIRDDTRRRVLEAVAALEYRPHHAARALSTSRSGAIGLVVPMLSSPLNAEIVAGAHASAAEHGLSLLLADSLLEPSETVVYRRLFDDGRVDGIVLQRNNEMRDEEIGEFLSGHWPGVVLNASIPGMSGTVALDDDRGIAVAVDHLTSLGHRDIGHLAGVPATDTARRRERAFRAALDRAALPVVEDWIVSGGHDVEGGRAGMRALLAAEPRPTAVVVANVIAAVGALDAASVAVPAELSLVAFHDMWFAEHTTPPLTTVRMPLRELGARAVREIARRMEGAPAVNAVVDEPPPCLVVRGSTSPPPTRRTARRRPSA